MATYKYYGHYTTNEQADKLWNTDEIVYTTPNYYGTNSDDAIRNADRVPEGYTELFYADRGTAGRRITYSCKLRRLSDGRNALFIHVHGADDEGLSAYANYAAGTNIEGENDNIEMPTTAQFTTGKYQNVYATGIMGLSHTGGTVPQCGWNSTTRNAYYYWNITHVWVTEEIATYTWIRLKWDNFTGWPGLDEPVSTWKYVQAQQVAYVKVNGEWKRGLVYRKENGGWWELGGFYDERMYAKVEGEWVETEYE